MLSFARINQGIFMATYNNYVRIEDDYPRPGEGIFEHVLGSAGSNPVTKRSGRDLYPTR